MRKYLYIIPSLLILYLITIPQNEEVSPELTKSPIVDNNKNLNAVVSYNNEVINMELDDYVVGVLACEMPASFEMQALKAGAIAARTFYMYKSQNVSYVASSNDQCYIGIEEMKTKWGDNFNKYYNVIKEAVTSTAGELITYKGDLIQSFYFSMSNGYTENLEDVFNDSRPYLVSVSSTWDKTLSTYEKTVTFDKSDFLNKLGLEITETINIEILSKTESGRIDSIKVNNKVFKGTLFRKFLGIRSTDFDIEVNENISITTRGYGHGVGMSQYGANEMAKLGYSYKEIIKHYYSGVEIFSV